MGSAALPLRRPRLVRIPVLPALITLSVVLVALFGGFLAPHSPYAIVGTPYSPPSGSAWLGTDFVGRDVLSRVLHGGQSVVLLAGLATLIGYAAGTVIGLSAAYSGGLRDTLLMRAMDVLLAFPPILFLLILATGAGPSQVALILGVATIHVPGVARILRSATLRLLGRGYVQAAVARGERPASVLGREIAPNIIDVVVADAGPRFTASILLVAALNYLGLGLQPPAANWALMISENRDGLTSQPWSVAGPALLIGLLTISVNLLADGLARARDRSIDPTALRR
jgi:peptide/nickel transport system permease protein